MMDVYLKARYIRYTVTDNNLILIPDLSCGAYCWVSGFEFMHKNLNGNTDIVLNKKTNLINI